VAEEGLIATEPPVDIPERADRIRAMLGAEDRSGSWVLESDGRVVGSAGAHETVPGVLSLGMAILPEARGRGGGGGGGGGRMLLDAVLAHATDREAHKVELEVWPDNGRAIALYVAAGFGVEGLRRDHYRRRDGTLRSALLMARYFHVSPLEHRSSAWG
jgi:RimJ/RimL family protein N-acetyltransferase